MTRWGSFLACVIVTGLTAFTLFSESDQHEPAVSAVNDETAGKVKPIDVNMHDFMEGVFQAPYRRLKPAMAQEPADNAAWKAIRSDALILAEGGNLLLARLPEKDVADWIKHSELSRDAGAMFVAAAKKKDFAGARKAYETMLTHCNDCHKQFEKGRHILEP